jgi:AcrR family transcriptional regulator
VVEFAGKTTPSTQALDTPEISTKALHARKLTFTQPKTPTPDFCRRLPMTEPTKDRRVQLTILMLKAALVQALQKEHISRITVTSICELADVNRSTFYAHFKDPYDLLDSIEQEVLSNIVQYLEKQDYSDNRPVSFQVLSSILDYVQANADLFKALLSDNCDSRIKNEIMNMTQVVSINLNKKYDSRVQDYLNAYNVTGCVSLLQKWLQDGMPEPSTQIAEYIMQMLYSGMSSFE